MPNKYLRKNTKKGTRKIIIKHNNSILKNNVKIINNIYASIRALPNAHVILH